MEILTIFPNNIAALVFLQNSYLLCSYSPLKNCVNLQQILMVEFLNLTWILEPCGNFAVSPIKASSTNKPLPLMFRKHLSPSIRRPYTCNFSSKMKKINKNIVKSFQRGRQIRSLISDFAGEKSNVFTEKGSLFVCYIIMIIWNNNLPVNSM